MTQAASSAELSFNACLAALARQDLVAAHGALTRLQMQAPASTALRYARGLCRLAAENATEALPDLEAAALSMARDAGAHGNLAVCQQALKDHGAALKSFERAIALAPERAEMHYGRAMSLLALQRDAAAIESLQACVEHDPQHASAWSRLAEAHYRHGDHRAAISAADRAMSLGREDAGVLKLRGLAHQALNEHEPAARDVLASARLRFAPGSCQSALAPALRRTSPAKLRHDIEQFEYLQARGLMAQAQDLAERHRWVLSRLPADLAPGRRIDLDPEQLAMLDESYNRLHFLGEAPRLTEGALNPALDGARIARDYAARDPGITWIDGLLREEAIASLRRYCLESTFWFDFEHANGYLGAFFEDGFAAPLLLQIAEELRAAAPAIFHDYPLIQLWAFKYDAHLDGIELHADIAAVNVNFWITPDEANLEPDRGGLMVWDRKAPSEWGLDDFNNAGDAGQARIARFLEESGAQSVRIPYRCNRAVVFHSDLFHRTDTIRFKPGYENRRINITMLFGKREGRTR